MLNVFVGMTDMRFGTLGFIWSYIWQPSSVLSGLLKFISLLSRAGEYIHFLNVFFTPFWFLGLSFPLYLS